MAAEESFRTGSVCREGIEEERRERMSNVGEGGVLLHKGEHSGDYGVIDPLGAGDGWGGVEAVDIVGLEVRDWSMWVESCGGLSAKSCVEVAVVGGGRAEGVGVVRGEALGRGSVGLWA